MPDVLDHAALRDLLAMVGDDPEFVDELVDAYLADTPVQLAELRTAAASGVADDLVRPAHTIKGASLNLGATGVASIARTIEERARAGELDGIDDQCRDLDAAYAQLVDALADARQTRWNGS